MHVLHILRSEPDEIVADFIETISGEQGAMVTALYPSSLFAEEDSQHFIDWNRLVDDIFACSKIISWW